MLRRGAGLGGSEGWSIMHFVAEVLAELGVHEASRRSLGAGADATDGVGRIAGNDGAIRHVANDDTARTHY